MFASQRIDAQAFDAELAILVGHKRVARQMCWVAHLAADAGVAGGAAALLENGLYGTLWGAKNSGPFWPQADNMPTDMLNKPDKSMTAMILGR